MQAALLALLRTAGSVVWAMVVELFTARFIRKMIKKGLAWAAAQTETKKDDEIVADATAEWEKNDAERNSPE